MKALQLLEAGQPLALREVAAPSPGAGELVVAVRAAGICHSDVHYRDGISPAGPLPLALGHEVAGVVESVGAAVAGFSPGDRVCLHYLATCGECGHCRGGHEQFCAAAQMIGKNRPGGYAERILMPARSVLHLPTEIPFEHGAVMMCSTATAWHALRKARTRSGEIVAVFGAGGLGSSAVQLARLLGAAAVFATDINPRKLQLAERLGAVPVDAHAGYPVAALREQTDGRGVDVALELIGLPETMQQAVRALAPLGRAAIAGLSRENFTLDPYRELIGPEAEVIGVSEHTASELAELLAFAREGRLDPGAAITRTVPLEVTAVNEALDGLASFGDAVRTVIVP